MSLREAARDTWLSNQQASEEEARSVLVNVLDDALLVDGLTTLHVQVGDGFVRWFFEDSEGLVLRVLRRSSTGVWTVNLVKNVDGVWQNLGEVLSLMQLWEILPELEISEVPQWIAGEDVVPGDVRLYDSIKYECLQGHTTQVGWEPPNVPALWAVVA